MYINFFLFFSMSFFALFLTRKLAKKAVLVDFPNQRKIHNGAIPLVGGLSIYLVFNFLLYFGIVKFSPMENYFILSFLFVFFGFLDDKFKLKYHIKLSCQIFLSILLVFYGDIKITSLGNVFGMGPIELGLIAPFFTCIIIVVVLNALNMIDGVDGLLAIVSIISFLSFSFVFYLQQNFILAYVCFVLIVIIIPYVILNLGILGERFKVFMGDAGSMFIGFMLLLFIYVAIQNETSAPLQPVTALWFISLPLMDMVSTVGRRLFNGKSPFMPDREHFHHIIQDLGYTPFQTLIILSLVSFVFAFFGVLFELQNYPADLIFKFFISMFFIYLFIVIKLSKIKGIKVIKGIKGTVIP